jgi:pantoate--beta-alanine ligase
MRRDACKLAQRSTPCKLSAMKIVQTIAAMQRESAMWVKSGKSVGLVPTLGALHEGHLTHMHRARQECQLVVVSIYVNPTQFGPKEDFTKYPRPRRQDLAMCRRAGVDLVFAPENLYLPDHSTFVEENALSQGRDGASRPGHFRGVATIVLKLLNLVRPTKAYFGQKDAQQVDVIQRMVRDLDMPVKIIVGPTLRDIDGVALSSRNVYLSPKERDIAVKFAIALQIAAATAKPASAEKLLLDLLKKIDGLKIDYVSLVGDRLCAAIYVGKTRLIDNELINKKRRP